MEPIVCKTRAEFHLWLEKNAATSEGVYLLFSKTKDIQTLSANEALEEALCFGWIDGVIKKIDQNSYMKYFSQRRKNSKWSLRNKKIVEDLLARNLVTELGLAKIEEAKQNGMWEAAKKPSDVDDNTIYEVQNLLQTNELAYTNFMNMSPSVKKTYTRAYLAAKTDDGKRKRLQWMIERLEKNLKPM